MKEQLISFETAKLAKEKGFNIPCLFGYGKKEELKTYNKADDFNSYVGTYTQISAPTQSLLQKWLREAHDLYVYCIPNINVLGVWHYVVEFKNKASNEISQHYDTYEEALEKGLQEALKLIKQ